MSRCFRLPVAKQGSNHTFLVPSTETIHGFVSRTTLSSLEAPSSLRLNPPSPIFILCNNCTRRASLLGSNLLLHPYGRSLALSCHNCFHRLALPIRLDLLDSADQRIPLSEGPQPFSSPELDGESSILH